MKSRFPLLLSALTAITFANVAAAADDYNALTDDEKDKVLSELHDLGQHKFRP